MRKYTSYILFILCCLLIATNILTITIAGKSATQFENILKTNPYPLLDFSRNFHKQEDYIVNLTPLRAELTNFIKKNTTSNISIYIEFLNTGSNISLSPDMRINPASLTKLPIAMIYMRKLELGELQMNSEFAITPADRDSAWGDFYKVQATTATLEELITQALMYSDNTAHNILYRNITTQDANLFSEDIGLEDLFDKNGEITAKEYARIFRALYTSSYLQKEHSQYLLALLAQSPYKNYLGSGISDDIVFSHKIGEKKADKIFLDFGIVYLSKRQYLISVLVKNIDTNTSPDTAKEQALEIMEKISKTTFEYMQTAKH